MPNKGCVEASWDKHLLTPLLLERCKTGPSHACSLGRGLRDNRPWAHPDVPILFQDHKQLSLYGITRLLTVSLEHLQK